MGLTANNQTIRSAEAKLKDITDLLTRAEHRHSGIIDPTRSSHAARLIAYSKYFGELRQCAQAQQTNGERCWHRRNICLREAGLLRASTPEAQAAAAEAMAYADHGVAAATLALAASMMVDSYRELDNAEHNAGTIDFLGLTKHLEREISIAETGFTLIDLNRVLHDQSYASDATPKADAVLVAAKAARAFADTMSKLSHAHARSQRAEPAGRQIAAWVAERDSAPSSLKAHPPSPNLMVPAEAATTCDAAEPKTARPSA